MLVTPVARFAAYALFAIAGASVLPLLLCIWGGTQEEDGYLLSLGFSTFAGGLAFALSLSPSSRPAAKAGLRELMLSLLLFWAGVPVAASLPFIEQGWAFDDAWFEAVSGLTTTGGWLSDPAARATLPGAIYRAELQWIGGLVSLCTAAAVFVRPEFIGVAPLVPPFARGESGSYLRAFRAALGVFAPVFVALTLLATAAFAALSVPLGEALVMAMSLLSTGGFIPNAGGVEAYGVPVTALAFLLALIGAANFIVIAGLMSGRGRRMRGGEDRETLALLLLVPAIGLLFWVSTGAGDVSRLLRQTFNAASILSTNGMTIGEEPQLTPVLVTSVIGGAAVSTAGGIKLLRWLITFNRMGEELWKLSHPGGVVPVKPSVDEFGVWIHTIAFTILLALIVLVTAFFGNSLEVSAATAVAVVANAGPLVSLAPNTTADFVLFDPALRPFFAVGMIAGRLELIVLLATANRRFWQA